MHARKRHFDPIQKLLFILEPFHAIKSTRAQSGFVYKSKRLRYYQQCILEKGYFKNPRLKFSIADCSKQGSKPIAEKTLHFYRNFVTLVC